MAATAGLTEALPALTRNARNLTVQIGMLIGINLLIGFTIPNIDNAAHIGGLLAGAILGFLPPREPRLRTGRYNGLHDRRTPALITDHAAFAPASSVALARPILRLCAMLPRVNR